MPPLQFHPSKVPAKDGPRNMASVRRGMTEGHVLARSKGPAGAYGLQAVFLRCREIGLFS